MWLIVLLLVHNVWSQTAPEVSTTPHVLKLDGGLTVRWLTHSSQWLVMEMSAPVKGYVSVGFSPQGGMTGSDIVMGWVDDNGEAKIMDLHANANARPVKDPSQDYRLLSGEFANGVTRIRFARKWKTCDEDHDIPLMHDTYHLIWALSDVKPESGNSSTFYSKYHEEKRGSIRTVIRFRVNQDFPDKGQSETKIWDVRVAQSELETSTESPNQACKILRFPDADEKHLLIGYRPLIDGENVHHISLHECVLRPESGNHSEGIFSRYLDKPARCHAVDTPLAWATYCTTTPIAWTAGSQGFMFPKNIGMPIGEKHGGASFFLLEVHYRKSESLSGNAGLRLYYTQKSRENEGGVMTIGHKITPFHVIPPKRESFVSAGFCTAECTSQTMPRKGVIVTAVQLQAHESAKGVYIRHFRSGRELAPIIQNFNFNHTLQDVQRIDPPRRILPGDELLAECGFTTTNANRPAFGGFGHETCLSRLYYHPKSPLAECKSQPEFTSFLAGLGIKKAIGQILSHIQMPYEPKQSQKLDYPDNPQILVNSTAKRRLNALDLISITDPQVKLTVGGALRGFNWTRYGHLVEQQWLNGNHYSFCTGVAKKRFPLKKYITTLPRYDTYVEPPTVCTGGKGSDGNSSPDIPIVLSSTVKPKKLTTTTPVATSTTTSSTTTTRATTTLGTTQSPTTSSTTTTTEMSTTTTTEQALSSTSTTTSTTPVTTTLPPTTMSTTTTTTTTEVPQTSTVLTSTVSSSTTETPSSSTTETPSSSTSSATTTTSTTESNAIAQEAKVSTTERQVPLNEFTLFGHALNRHPLSVTPSPRVRVNSRSEGIQTVPVGRNPSVPTGFQPPAPFSRENSGFYRQFAGNQDSPVVIGSNLEQIPVQVIRHENGVTYVYRS